MKYGYSFSKLCGAVYRGGNIVFTQDGTRLLTPVGNRVTVLDLVRDSCDTLPLQHNYNIKCLALSKDDKLLVTVDSEGHAVILNFHKQVTLATMHFTAKEGVTSVAFSPNGRYLAVAHDNWLSVWKSPALVVEWKPLQLHLKLKRIHYGRILTVQWSLDSEFLITGSKDRSARIHAVNKKRPFRTQALTGHRGYVIAAFFGTGNMIYTITHKGFIYKWKVGASEELEEEYGDEGRGLPLLMYGRVAGVGKHMLHIKGAVDEVISCASFGCQGTDLLVVGKANGLFDLYQMPDWRLIHSVSASKKALSACVVSPTGDWLAFAADNGQVAVWEWRSETYVLRQQGHHWNMSAVQYSADGQLLATGGDDGKVKLWNSKSGFCFMTFADHCAPVTGIRFAQSGVVMATASLDGTVRVYDLVRYKNFRTLKADTRRSERESALPKDMLVDVPLARFVSLAMDCSAEVICAGTEEPFEIYVWSMRTGRVLDILTGHTAPVCALSFSSANQLASGSWDMTVRLWDVFVPNSRCEVLETASKSEVLDVCHSPDAKELCVATLKGQLEFYETSTGKLKRTLDVRRDAMGGRASMDMVRAEKNSRLNHFGHVVYAANGDCVLAAGSGTKYMALYHAGYGVLLSRYMTSRNKELEGIQDNRDLSRPHSSAVLESAKEKTHDVIKARRLELPGVDVATMDYSSRRIAPRIGTRALAFSPTGMQFAAVTTEGLLIYNKATAATRATFDPVDLDQSITPLSVMSQMRSLLEEESAKAETEDLTKMTDIFVEDTKVESSHGTEEKLSAESKSSGTDYLTVVLMSLKLNDDWLLTKALESVPPDFIGLVVASIPRRYLQKVMQVCAEQIGESQFLEFYLLWTRAILTTHGAILKDNFTEFTASLKHITQKSMGLYRHLKPICDGTAAKLDFLSTASTQKTRLTFPSVETEDAVVVPRGEFAPVPFQGVEDDE